jgi:type I restriction enzyme S subunit
MRAMKDSGIEWIGKIPQGWDVTPMFIYFKERKCRNIGNAESNLLSLSYGNIVKKDINDNMGLLPESFEGYNIIEKDNIVFRLTDLQNDHTSLRSAIVKERGIITSAYVTIEAIKEICTYYFNYLFRCYDLQKAFYNMGGGVRQGLNYDGLRKVPIFVPPIIEQQHIADYLDKKCTQLESIIEKQQTVIEKLKAYKQSVIAEAVTKGLDPSVPMKDSGTEWIGKIPQEWEIKRLKYCFCLQTRKANSQNNPVALENIESWSGRYIATESVFDGEGVAFEKGDILFGKLRPYLAKVYLAEFPGTGIGDFLILRPQQQMHGSYSAYLLRTHMYINVIDGSTYGAKMPRASWEFMGNLSCIVPPIEEQKRIAEFVNSKCAEIDNAIEQKQKLIDRLNDYKKSLIFEAVTGKIEV